MKTSTRTLLDASLPSGEPSPSDDPQAKLERLILDADWTHAFCEGVIGGYAQQEASRGRLNYGLTRNDGLYARSVLLWSDYRADVARWSCEPANREAIAASKTGTASDAQQRRLATRARPPTAPRPAALTTPPDWPATFVPLSEVTAEFYRVRWNRLNSD